MADHNDRNQGSDDLYDEAAPRSIFAATWFRAVLVLIVLGVIGAVAVPYILDAMNSPPRLAAKPSPPVPAPSAPASTMTPGAVTQVTPKPTAPPPATPVPPPSSSATAPPTPSTLPEKSAEKADKKDAMIAATTAVPETTAKPEPKPAPKPAASAEAPSKPAPKMAKAPTAAVRSTSGGQWFVQVGAFKDPATARKVAAKLREDKYTVEERGGSVATVAKATTSSPSAPTGADQYDVIVAGQSPAELNKRLSAKGLTAEATQNGAIVRPSLPLRDAVALSKELAVDGSKVQVRRAGGSSAAAARTSSAAKTSTSGETLHRVSVGGFADRAAALAALKELETKGYKPFLTRR